MPDISGGVDLRGRPIVRLKIAGFDDELLAMVDTGFNDELLMSEADAAVWGVVAAGLASKLELGDGTLIFARRGTVNAVWMGERRVFRVQITPNVKGTRQADAPVALIGTRLLADDKLEIDFPRKSLRIWRDTP
jgi:hypothetical protein